MNADSNQTTSLCQRFLLGELNPSEMDSFADRLAQDQDLAECLEREAELLSLVGTAVSDLQPTTWASSLPSQPLGNRSFVNRVAAAILVIAATLMTIIAFRNDKSLAHKSSTQRPTEKSGLRELALEEASSDRQTLIAQAWADQAEKWFDAEPALENDDPFLGLAMDDRDGEVGEFLGDGIDSFAEILTEDASDSWLLVATAAALHEQGPANNQAGEGPSDESATQEATDG